MAGHRARAVCVNCHARKVKCDIERRGNGPCENCQRHALTCRQRRSSRQVVRDRSESTQLDATSHSPQQLPLTPASNRSAFHLTGNTTADSTKPGTTEPTCPPYIGETSFMHGASPHLPAKFQQVAGFSELVKTQLLETSDATTIPPRILLQASTDAYFQHVFHRIPVLDRQDMTNTPSPLLCQAVCLIGSMMRHPKGSTPLAESQRFYIRAKSLLFLNDDKDFLTVLKALCLLITWNGPGPTVLSLDCSWHWLGIATRLLFQMGFHREHICARSPHPSLARRIAWSLFDKMLAAAFARPVCITMADFDVRPLQITDFDANDEIIAAKGSVFIEYTKIVAIIGRIIERRKLPQALQSQEHESIRLALQDWIHRLPDNVRLASYQRDVYELHIIYFVTIIIYFQLQDASQSRLSANLASILASSCIARLYEEMECRDDTNYLLGLHNWYLLVACVQQLQCGPGHDDLCGEELDMLVSTLRIMDMKWPGAATVRDVVLRLRNSERSRRDRSPVSNCLTDAERASLKGLFPFPASMSPRLAVLEESNLDDILAEYGHDLFDEDVSWIFTEVAEASDMHSFVDGHNLFSGL